MLNPLTRIRAVVVDHAAAGRLSVREVDRPCPSPHEALIRVAATSLNQGEVRRAMAEGADGMRPGWDLAGTVEAAAADGSGPEVGARVVGLVESGAWAEVVAVPVDALAGLPDAVSFADAATLPVAGLTALHNLGHGGLLVGRRILVTGASGGVGLFAVQIAQAAGACVVAAVRSPEHAAMVKGYGADHMAVGDGVADAAAYGPYHLIVDAVGGPSLGARLALLREGGALVLYGSAGTPEAPIQIGTFVGKGGTSLHGFQLFHALRQEPACEGLRRLLALIQGGKLRPCIEIGADWTDIAPLAQRLMDRSFFGKAVLHISRKGAEAPRGRNVSHDQRSPVAAAL